MWVFKFWLTKYPKKIVFKIHWLTFYLAYLIFFLWYTNLSGPLSDSEISNQIIRIQENPNYLEDEKENLIKFIKKDDGGDFYMINFIDFNENPPTLEATGENAPASALIDYYMEYMYPELFKRASHPVFYGEVSANALDNIGAEENKEWDVVGIVRYRSIRDLLEISGNETFRDRHIYKIGAMSKTIVIPVPSPFLIDLRVFIFMLLLIITLITDRIRKR